MPSLDFYLDCMSDDATDTFGGRLTRAHDLAGLTLEALAARIGVKTRLLRSWESDRAEPTPAQIAALAMALRVSPMWLSAGIGDGPEEGDDTRSRMTLKSTP